MTYHVIFPNLVTSCFYRPIQKSSSQASLKESGKDRSAGARQSGSRKELIAQLSWGDEPLDESLALDIKYSTILSI